MDSTPDKTAADKAAADKAAADKAADDKRGKVAKTDAGDVIVDFTDYNAAIVQAKAMGGHHVQPIGVAFHVAKDD